MLARLASYSSRERPPYSCGWEAIDWGGAREDLPIVVGWAPAQ